MSRVSYYTKLSPSKILAKLNSLCTAIFHIWVIIFFNPFIFWILPHTKVRETTVHICCLCCPALPNDQIFIFFSLHLVLLEPNPSLNTVWPGSGNLKYCICLSTVMVKEWTLNPNWAFNMEGCFALISGKDISALCCGAWDYIRTGDPTIILWPLGTKHVKASQEVTKDKMSPIDIVWTMEGPNNFHFV